MGLLDDDDLNRLLCLIEPAVFDETSIRSEKLFYVNHLTYIVSIFKLWKEIGAMLYVIVAYIECDVSAYIFLYLSAC